MTPEKTQQTMKPETAAKKLGVLLAATPAEFQAAPVSRTALNELLTTPPEWLVQLRLHGPHPKQIVAGKLGISLSGLARGEVTEPLTTAEITALLVAPPQWLVRERATQAAVRTEKERIKAQDAEKERVRARDSARLAREENA
jgi:hypothetical protein